MDNEWHETETYYKSPPSISTGKYGKSFRNIDFLVTKNEEKEGDKHGKMQDNSANDYT